MTLDFRKLRHLVAVAHTGNLSSAADVLHISQPALSRSISVAEEQLGVQVFDRSYQGAKLTGAGKIVIAEAEKLLSQVRIFDHNVELCSKGDYGTLAFGMWPVLASMVLPDLSASLINAQPQLNIWAAVKSSRALLKSLYDDEIEFFFCGEGQIEDTPDLNIEVLGKLNLVVLVRAEHPLVHQKRIGLEDIESFPLLAAVDLSQVPERFRANGVFCCDTPDIILSTALNTNGVWIAPAQLASQELEAGLLREIIVVDQRKKPLPPTLIPIQVVYLEGYQLSPTARKVVEYLRNFFQECS